MNDTAEIITSIVATTLFLVILLFSPFVRFNTTRAGEHNGYVTAIEQKGLVFHNYIVYFKTENSSSQEDTYCVQENDIELANSLRAANKSRQLVTIHYEGVRGLGLSLCKGEAIKSIEIAK